MNRNTNRKTNEKTTAPHAPTLGFLKEQRTRVVIGLALLLFSLYLLFSLVGFFFTGGIDQSLIDKGLGKIIANPDITASNPAGKLGAWFSDILINRWFGISSLILCYVLTIISVRIMGRHINGFVRKIFISLVLTVWISLFLGYMSELVYNLFKLERDYLFLGGAHGYFVTNWLNALTGGIGTFFILLLSFAVILFFGFEKAFYRCVDIVKEIFRKREKPLKAEAPIAAATEQEAPLSDDIENIPVELQDEANPFNEINRDNQYFNPGAEFENRTDFTEQEENPEQFLTENEEIIEDQEFQNVPASITDDEIQPQEIDFDAPELIPDDITLNDSDILTVNNSAQEETVSQNITPTEDYDPTLDLSNYQYPPLELLEEHSSGNPKVTQEELEENKNKIVETLRNYKIEIIKIKATIGPTVTLYEIIPAPGVKISKIKNLEDDIALSLAALGIRIIAPIPGAGTIGIEVPNQNPEVVSMRGIIASKKFQESKYALPVALGRTISNETYTFDLTKMPHLLVAGATGQGKSVGLNAIITSLLYKKHPSQLKFVMVDPKKVELSIYSVIEKHFLAKLPDEEDAIITETSKVVNTLNSLCIEMDSRYDLLKEAQVRNIKEYNDKFIKRQLNPNKGHKYLPYIVVIVDEFADLIMTAGKEVEQPIARIAQLARAIGIHMIIATQRPSTNIITGVIKANFPARIAFKVASMIDSRTILDSPGANQLIGRGDMLISVGSEMTRVQCAFVDTPEVDAITTHIASQQSYPSALALPEYVPETDGSSISEADLGAKDSLFEEAARLVVNTQQGSTSSIQRRFSIGYNRAGRIIDQLEAAGIVGPFEGSKARQVLIPDEYSLEMILRNIGDKI